MKRPRKRNLCLSCNSTVVVCVPAFYFVVTYLHHFIFFVPQGKCVSMNWTFEMELIVLKPVINYILYVHTSRYLSVSHAKRTDLLRLEWAEARGWC